MRDLYQGWVERLAVFRRERSCTILLLDENYLPRPQLRKLLAGQFEFWLCGFVVTYAGEGARILQSVSKGRRACM